MWISGHKQESNRCLSTQQFMTTLNFIIYVPTSPQTYKMYSKDDTGSVTITTNIESQEFRCHYGEEKGLPPEHPRAGSTDDVETIFAFLNELLGLSFDEKAFDDAFPLSIQRHTTQTSHFTITLGAMMDTTTLAACHHSTDREAAD